MVKNKENDEMTPKFQGIYEQVIGLLSEARTKGSKTGNKTILVMFDKTRVRDVLGVRALLDDMKVAYFDYLERNFREEHGDADMKKFAPMFTQKAKDAAWNSMVTVKRTYDDVEGSTPETKDKDVFDGRVDDTKEVFIAEVDINAGVVNSLMNKIITDKHFTYHWSVAPIYDLFIGSSYQGVMDPSENPLVIANVALKKKYRFVADELKKENDYVNKAARKEKKQKFLRQ